MPLFHYMCEDCGTRTELLVKADAKPVCPGCGSDRMLKQASVFSARVAAAHTTPAGPPSCHSCCHSDACSMKH